VLNVLAFTQMVFWANCILCGSNKFTVAFKTSTVTGLRSQGPIGGRTFVIGLLPSTLWPLLGNLLTTTRRFRKACECSAMTWQKRLERGDRPCGAQSTRHVPPTDMPTMGRLPLLSPQNSYCQTWRNWDNPGWDPTICHRLSGARVVPCSERPPVSLMQRGRECLSASWFRA